MGRTLTLLLLLAVQAAAGSFKLMSDSLELDVGRYRYLSFRITPEQAENARISGEFHTFPDSMPMELLLLSKYNYLMAWDSMQPIDTLAGGIMLPGPLDIPIPEFGDYVLIISNRGNYDTVTFFAELQVDFTGSGITYDALPTGTTVLITLFAAGLVVAAVVITVKKLG